MKRHEVAVFYYKNTNAETFNLEQGNVNGINTYVMNIPGKELKKKQADDLSQYSILNYRNSYVDNLFKKSLLDFNPDVVHLQHLLYSSMNFPKIIHHSGIPIVHTLHDYHLMCPCVKLLDYNLRICEEINIFRCFMSNFRSYVSTIRPYSKKNLIRRILTGIPYSLKLFYHISWRRSYFIKHDVFRHVDLFISPSHFLKNKFIEFGIPAEKIIYSDNGMHIDLVKNDKYEGKEKKNMMTFGYIGGHQIEKGVPLLINAFNSIKNANLFIYGSGKETEYRQMITNQNIYLKGRIEDNEKPQVFNHMDVLIVPSIWYENSPLTIHEAFIFKVPVLTSNIGGMAELVKDNVNGLHFQVGDIDDLCRKINYCIEHPEEVEQMARNTPAVKSISDNAEELEKMYYQLKRIKDL
jgi:glycosyltransferase involved in cell wall biosynthesis